MFKGKTAIVTGGATGIGRAAAIRFANEGASVVIANRNAETGQSVVDEIKSAGGSAIFVQTDVSVAGDVERMVDRCISEFGSLDIAFNNAGVSGSQFIPSADFSEDDWDFTLDINLKGVWLCHKYQIPAMIRSGGGAIVNNSSVAGKIAAAHGAHYAASKHGVLGLTKSMAWEYAKYGIRVNAVCPGVIDTELADFLTAPEVAEKVKAMHALNRFASPAEVANAVVWLCSEDASFVTGTSLDVDGGFLSGR